MKFNELTTILEQDEGSMFTSRNLKSRKEQHLQQFNKRIYDYISSIPSFPKNTVNHLDLDGYPGKELPDDLKYVDGSLNLSNSKIKRLPENLEITGTLTLHAVEADVIIPDSVTYSGLDISMSGVSKVPGNRTINFLYIADNWNVKALPNGLAMLDLDATTSMLEYIPKDIKVFQSVYISETPFIDNFIDEGGLQHMDSDRIIEVLKIIYPGMKDARIYI